MQQLEVTTELINLANSIQPQDIGIKSEGNETSIVDKALMELELSQLQIYNELTKAREVFQIKNLEIEDALEPDMDIMGERNFKNSK